MSIIGIRTVSELQRAITMSKTVYIQPRLGCMEIDVKISKKEARLLADCIAANPDPTPDNLECSNGRFGIWNPITNILFLG